jgi:regulator of replication initiation timing
MLLPVNESSELVQETKLFTSKLKGMRLHLQELIAKKIRLELEIKQLKKSITNKQKHVETSVKAKLALESTDVIPEDLTLKIQREEPELFYIFKEFDEEEKRYLDLIQETETRK